LRPRTTLSCAAIAACALTIPVADADAGVLKKRMHVRVGDKAAVIGSTQPGVATLQVRRRGTWRTIARDRTTAAGRYVLRDRVRRPMSLVARVSVNGVTQRIGRLNGYRRAYASWYGPGLYGNHLGCGGRLTPRRLGVAHKTLPCGTKLRLRHRGRSVAVRVIDRGPYVAGREFDLTERTARRLHFRGHGSILTTR
jgi:rare lipoprotein A (peptidoglycan hydrolase)